MKHINNKQDIKNIFGEDFFVPYIDLTCYLDKLIIGNTSSIQGIPAMPTLDETLSKLDNTSKPTKLPIGYCTIEDQLHSYGANMDFVLLKDKDNKMYVSQIPDVLDDFKIEYVEELYL